MRGIPAISGEDAITVRKTLEARGLASDEKQRDTNQQRQEREFAPASDFFQEDNVKSSIPFVGLAEASPNLAIPFGSGVADSRSRWRIHALQPDRPHPEPRY